jgi:hypothetical protein
LSDEEGMTMIEYDRIAEMEGTTLRLLRKVWSRVVKQVRLRGDEGAIQRSDGSSAATQGGER